MTREEIIKRRDEFAAYLERNPHLAPHGRAILKNFEILVSATSDDQDKEKALAVLSFNRKRFERMREKLRVLKTAEQGLKRD